MPIFEFICRILPKKWGLPILALIVFFAWYFLWFHEDRTRRWFEEKLMPIESAAMNAQAADIFFAGFFFLVLVLSTLLAGAYASQWFLARSRSPTSAQADTGRSAETNSQPYSQLWEKNPVLTLQEAACLWIGVEPQHPEPREAYVIMQRLIHAVGTGDLQRVDLSYSELWDQKVQRADLIEYANKIEDQPAFLFTIDDSPIGVEAPVTLEYIEGYEYKETPTEQEQILYSLGVTEPVYIRIPLLLSNAHNSDLQDVVVWVTDVQPMPSRVKRRMPFKLPIDEENTPSKIETLKQGIPRRLQFISRDQRQASDQLNFCSAEHGEIEPFERDKIFENEELFEEYRRLNEQPMEITVSVEARDYRIKQYRFLVALADDNNSPISIIKLD